MSKISTAAYAILGLLSMRQWSTYELVQYMKRSNLRSLWPRAESQVYQEPKRLENADLAKSKISFNGERKRTVYAITRAGRAAFRKWLGQPSERFSYRSEAMVQVSFADFGTIEDLRRNIEEIRQEAEEDAAVMLDFAEERKQLGPLFAKRAHVNALTALFILDLMEARIRWARSAEETIRDWKSSEAGEGSLQQGNDTWDQIHRRLKRLLKDVERRAA